MNSRRPRPPPSSAPPQDQDCLDPRVSVPPPHQTGRISSPPSPGLHPTFSETIQVQVLVKLSQVTHRNWHYLNIWCWSHYLCIISQHCIVHRDNSITETCLGFLFLCHLSHCVPAISELGRFVLPIRYLLLFSDRTYFKPIQNCRFTTNFVNVYNGPNDRLPPRTFLTPKTSRQE